eukprot:CAMPEP_0182418430 /NCGR_PEP_ID=MMETSP1167-20130531/2868_1 /TAXON_ID=2988 /ORGANISM="Mallomonas Sp, Strain CCMP3275" /LENGTH=782 /DNA_ID=CAMNT_0024592639 /DNA_START=430 /DNA_END=2778 /DNA_ORIENTATION=-
MSDYPRSRAALGKEKKLIPYLTAIMRYGCVEADRVQHFCAIAICNVLATHMERSLVEELIRNETVKDLVTVTQLRVNSSTTKLHLGKALFNLLGRAELRQEMVELHVFEALIELGKNTESVDLLELAVKTVLNLSCEAHKYSHSLRSLGVPAWLLARVAPSPSTQSVRATAAIKAECGQALANISFDKHLAVAINAAEKASEALTALYNLHSDDTSYCVTVSLYNLSKLQNCDALAASTTLIPLLVDSLTRGPILCIQLAAATLCNFSLRDPFHDQLTNIALSGMIKVIASPTIDISVKLDAVHFLYNLVTAYPPSRIPAVEAGAVASLVKLVKSQDEEDLLSVLGRITKELCSEIVVYKKLISDGIMKLLLKLSKIELGPLKLDISCAIYSLSGAADAIKLLQQDCVDVVFWLTIHDVLGLNDPIRRNATRAIRNLTVIKEEADVLCREERFFTVLRAFSKSTNEDVLWQTAAVLYNLLNTPTSVDVMLRRGAVPLVMDLATSGHGSVRHLCSACLHAVPESIPDPENTAVLELIMCLLDADVNVFSELHVKTTEELEYSLGAHHLGSEFAHSGTEYKANWIPMPCVVDKLFAPASVEVSSYQVTTVNTKDHETKPTASALLSLSHKKLTGLEFNLFLGSTKPQRLAHEHSFPIPDDEESEGGEMYKPEEREREREREKEREGETEGDNDKSSYSGYSSPQLSSLPPVVRAALESRGSSPNNTSPPPVPSQTLPPIGLRANTRNETPIDTLGAINSGLYKSRSNKQVKGRTQQAFSNKKKY